MQKKKIHISLTDIVFVFLLILFAFGIFYICSEANEYVEANKTYKSIQTEFTEEKTDNSDESELIIKWQSLKKQNFSIIAWIDIPGTEISYPIVQGRDNNEYLRRDINHKYSKAGSIFIDSRNQSFEDFNTIVYGHNLNNGIMFSNLKKYKKASYAEAHPTVYIYLPDGSCLEYKVFAFSKVNADDFEIYSTDISDKTAYLRAVQENNLLNIDIDENRIKSVITLSTCTNADDNERYVLCAALFI